MAAKKVVVIFSKYEATEKTLCALYLADHILCRYKYAIWVVPEDVKLNGRYAGFSHKWDKEVISLASNIDKVKALLAKCEMCIFLDDSETLFSLLPPKAKTACFLDPHTWHYEQSRQFAKKCDYVLSTSHYITKKLVRANLFTHDIFCPFTPTIQLIPRVWIDSGEVATIFYPAYGMSFAEKQCLRQIAEIVKMCCPKTKSVIGTYNTREKSEIGMDTRAYDWKMLDYVKQSDWIIDLNPRPLFGLFASLAGSAGIQWSCFDIPPHNDDYNAARRHLIDYPDGGLTMENADGIAENIVRQLSEPLGDEATRMQGAGAYAKRLKEYSVAMNRLFGKKNR